VRHDLRLVQLLMTNAANGGGSASLPATRNGPISVAGLTLRMEDLEPLLGLPAGAIGPRPDPRMVAAPGGTARRAIAVVMARAAAMHTDLMLAASADLALAGASSRNSETSATRIVDGERSDIWSSAVYWEVARQAMDHVLVTPRGGAPTRDWYYATLEFLLSRREYDAALPHAAYGRLVLKTDGRIAFYLGAILENLASPNVQAAVGDNPARVGLEERPVLLHRAEEALRSALELDPKLDEAALRLARVCQVTGRYEDAANLLRRIESTLNRAELRYYAALFVGRY
jgi:tetratricopeptide (TPR) repeat protein